MSTDNYEQPPVPQNPYPPVAAPSYPPYQASAQQAEGAKHAQNSLLFGILAFVVIGVVFGPLAIIEARKAEVLGADAHVGNVLGWIATIFSGAVVVVSLVLFFLVLIAGASRY